VPHVALRDATARRQFEATDVTIPVVVREHLPNTYINVSYMQQQNLIEEVVPLDYLNLQGCQEPCLLASIFCKLSAYPIGLLYT
jgi:hypothetical protein